MKSCWAACLGGCSKKLSHEHLVSQSLFVGERIRVQGFPWCKEASKEIGLSTLTSKILRISHNQALSPIDATGAQAFSTFREMQRLANVRTRLRPRVWKVRRYVIEGPQLERWLLKTLINISCNGPYPIGRNSHQAGRPLLRRSDRAES